ncbi:MAG: hypothetical protein J6S21_04245 [Victivallales bacterium]|nr:hypothetical protein [Victivallales bacterium]
MSMFWIKIIIMVIGGGIALYGKSQMRTGAPWAQPVSVLGALMAFAVAMWSLYGTIFQGGAAAAIEREHEYTRIEHKFLGEAIVKEVANVKKVVVLVDSSMFYDEWGAKRPTPLPYPALDGLKQGLGSGVEVVEVMPEVKQIKKPADPNALPPMMMGMMMDRRKFAKCVADAKAAKGDVFVALSMLPPEVGLGNIAKSLKGMKVALANCGSLDIVGQIFNDGGKSACDLIAVVTSKASAIYDEELPSNETKAFNRRYSLITKSNYQTEIKKAQAK